jgi:predicted oxidoreductase
LHFRMCIGYLELNQLKVSLSMNGLLFFYLTLWTTFAPQVWFCKSFGKSFSKTNSFQIVKGIRI